MIRNKSWKQQTGSCGWRKVNFCKDGDLGDDERERESDRCLHLIEIRNKRRLK